MLDARFVLGAVLGWWGLSKASWREAALPSSPLRLPSHPAERTEGSHDCLKCCRHP